MFSYCALRRIPNKLGGVLALFLSLLILLTLPLLYRCRIKGSAFYPLSRFLFWCLVVVFIIITIIGIAPVEAPFTYVGLVATFFYFLLFCIISKVSSMLEGFLL